LEVHYKSVLGDISSVIDAARKSAARSVNCTMTAAYWLIGRSILEFEQKGSERADYGEELLKRLSRDLTSRYGRGFAKSNLYQMRSFYMAYQGIFQTPSGKSDSLVPSNGLQNFQTASGISELLNFQEIQSVASRFPLPWSAYVRLLGIKNEHARTFYETEALRGGWSVRQLDRQVNSQLKIGKFTHADAGQMHLYLNYAKEHWVHGDENPPVGLILCAQKNEAVARYALEGLPNKVMASEYRTALPDEKELAAEIGRTQALLQDRKRLALTSPIVVRAKKSAKKELP
jgi:hypothetical protein